MDISLGGFLGLSGTVAGWQAGRVCASRAGGRSPIGADPAAQRATPGQTRSEDAERLDLHQYYRHWRSTGARPELDPFASLLQPGRSSIFPLDARPTAAASRLSALAEFPVRHLAVLLAINPPIPQRCGVTGTTHTPSQTHFRVSSGPGQYETASSRDKRRKDFPSVLAALRSHANIPRGFWCRTGGTRHDGIILSNCRFN